MFDYWHQHRVAISGGTYVLLSFHHILSREQLEEKLHDLILLRGEAAEIAMWRKHLSTAERIKVSTPLSHGLPPMLPTVQCRALWHRRCDVWASLFVGFF